MGVLLPVHEVPGRQHLERVALDRRAAMGRRTQADHLRAKTDRPIVAIAGEVVETDKDRHGMPWCRSAAFWRIRRDQPGKFCGAGAYTDRRRSNFLSLSMQVAGR